MSSFEDWARANKETLLKFGKSRSNVQRELKKILSEEQFLSAKKWFKQLGKTKSYTAALRDMLGATPNVEDDGEHTDVSEFALEHPERANVQDVADKLVNIVERQDVADKMINIVERQDADAAFHLMKKCPGLMDVKTAADVTPDIVASLKRTIDEMNSKKPLSIYEKLSRIVEK